MSNTTTNLSPEPPWWLAELGRMRAKPRTLRDNTWFIDALGCFVMGPGYLLGGAPGSRKSGLATQIALDTASQGKVLIVPTEEPADRVLERVVKMMGGFDAADITIAQHNLIIERSPPSVEQLTNCVSSQVLSPSGANNGITPAMLDSVQGHGLVSAATRAYDRVLEAVRRLSSANVTSLLVNHLNKTQRVGRPAHAGA